MKSTFICAGPQVTVGELREFAQQKIANLKKHIEQTADEHKGKLSAKLVELETGVAKLVEKPEDEMVGRRGCGADLTAQLEAIPQDGEVYEYECPKCGNTGTVRRTPPEAPAESAAAGS